MPRLSSPAAAAGPLLPSVLLLPLLLGPLHAQAVLPDEIQVYDDAINEPGEVGLELHVNATPSGRADPAYRGEFLAVHGLRTTAELSYGLSRTVELGLYLPFAHMADGTERFAGPKLRLKYIPQRASAGNPWFYGVNFELSHVKRQFDEGEDSLEVRPIIGWHAAGWLVSCNPVVGVPLKPGERAGGPDFSPSLKVARDVAAGAALGLEYYASLGQFSHFAAYSEQEHTLFLALDIDRKPYVFNFGIGRGLSSEADRWTLKAVIEVPL